MSDMWQVGGASVTGAAHIRSGRINQDALAFLPEVGAPSRRITAAVSDGHGAAAHFRSQIGARLAADGAARLFEWQIDEAGADTAADNIITDIVDYWRNAVRTDLATAPYGPDDPIASSIDEYTPYGATLIAFAANSTKIAAFQIGDGDMLFGYEDGRIVRPMRPDPDLFGEATYSLCLPDAVAHFRSASVVRGSEAGWPDFVCITTDGIDKSFRDDATFLATVAELRRNAMDDWDALLAAMPAWLDDLSQHGSGDDSTIAFARRLSF